MDALIGWFGTLASVVVAISLMMRNLRRLRILNLAGSAMFSAYGAAIGSVPVFALNLFIVGIDAWYLAKMRRERSAFSLLHVDIGKSEYLAGFLDFYAKDIARFAPEFQQEELEGSRAVFVLRDMVPAGLVVYRRREDGDVDLLLDYAAPAWRDYKSAEYFFGAAAKDIAGGARASAGGGATVFRARASAKAHAAYLERMGFRRAADGSWELGVGPGGPGGPGNPGGSAP